MLSRPRGGCWQEKEESTLVIGVFPSKILSWCLFLFPIPIMMIYEDLLMHVIESQTNVIRKNI